MVVMDKFHPNAKIDHQSTHEYAMVIGSRTPEQVQADRLRIFALSPEPRALPAGMTLEDIIVGQWPGDETDEEVAEALADLS